MTLIQSPPSILGGVIPHPGLAPTSKDNLKLNGWPGWSAALGNALTDLQINFDISGTATLTAYVNDPHRDLLNGALATTRSYADIDGVTFMLTEVVKQGAQVQLVFDHELVGKLIEHTEDIVVAQNTMTRTAFVRRLCSFEPWIKVLTPNGDSDGNVQSALTSGNVDPTSGLPSAPTIATLTEDPPNFWDTIQQTLDVIGWRAFPVSQNELMVVPDSWLWAQKPAYVLDESSPGVDSIDFDFDMRRPLAKATINCRAEAWAWPVGTCVQLGPRMGIAAGKWIVNSITRSLLRSNATVGIAVPQPTIPEGTVDATGAAAQVGAALGNPVDLSSSGSGVLSGNTPMPSNTSNASNQALGKQMAAAVGWTGSQWIALNNVVMAESGWNVHATNPSSGAYGIPQSLPADKLASAGSDWQTNPATQIKWLLQYIAQRYGTPVAAWNLPLQHNRY
jgi:hypothetical protein